MKWLNLRGRKKEKLIASGITDGDLQDVLNGEYIDEKTAMSISAVFAAVRILSQTVATLPIHLYKKSSKGRESVKDSRLSSLIARPNSYISTYDLLEHLMVSVVLWGNGYALIHRDKFFQPSHITYLAPDAITPELTRDDRMIYRSTSYSRKIYQAEDIIHVKYVSLDGITGLSPIAVHRENLRLSKQVQTYGQSFFARGGNTEMVIEAPFALKKDQADLLRTQINEKIVGVRNSHRPLILEGGMKANRLNIPPEDAQFIGTRKFQVTEVARIYGIPPHMIGDLERSTNNNIEHQGSEFLIYCLAPYLKKIEEELNYKLLPLENKDLYFKFNVNGLLRADAKTRSEFYKTMLNMGVMSANEIRELEDMNSYEDGDHFFMQLNMSTVDKIVNTPAGGEGKNE